VDIVLREGDELTVGDLRFTALLTPGHVPDALCLVGDVGGRRVIFTGDTAIGDQGARKGVVGWLDGHWSSNPYHLLASLDRMAAAGADLMLAGHGLPIDGAANVATSLQHCRQRVEMLLAIPDLSSMMPLDLSR
jgi:glyoxylase-like metal-dependent hydrolase (beta-lactamase superfamily II)